MLHWNESVATSVAAWLFKGLYMFLQVYNIRINIDFFFTLVWQVRVCYLFIYFCLLPVQSPINSQACIQAVFFFFLKTRRPTVINANAYFTLYVIWFWKRLFAIMVWVCKLLECPHVVVNWAHPEVYFFLTELKN